MAKSNVGPNALGPGTRASSKHWANWSNCVTSTMYMGGQYTPTKERHAAKAETLFFTWLWRKG